MFVAEADEEDGTEEVGMAWLVKARPDIATDYALNEGGGERLELADGRVVVTVNIGEKAPSARWSPRWARPATPRRRRRAPTRCRVWRR